uniref:Uncharacterized protein n=1 Tax=Leersia perrieri TaxID=77586 RepID=A0A0D9V283_9ORYZ
MPALMPVGVKSSVDASSNLNAVLRRKLRSTTACVPGGGVYVRLCSLQFVQQRSGLRLEQRLAAAMARGCDPLARQGFIDLYRQWAAMRPDRSEFHAFYLLCR